jgi:predicted ATPase/DNA-binding SARP family transcriptional activator
MVTSLGQLRPPALGAALFSVCFAWAGEGRGNTGSRRGASLRYTVCHLAAARTNCPPVVLAAQTAIPVTASRLEIRLLGQFDLQYAGQSQRLPSRPAQSLLAYLALTAGTVHRRERLAGLLWPDATDANARAYLRSALWRVRQALPSPDFLLIDEINLGFNPQAPYWLDTAALEQASAGECQLPALMETVGLYRGELLPGVYDEWVGPERERLHAAFDQRAQRLVECLAEAQRWPETQTWAEFWVARTPTAEVAYRGLMQASDARQDLAGVAAAYERCRVALQAELAVEPSAATQALYARLRQPASEPAPAEPARLPISATPFIGREAELAEVGRLLQRDDCRLLTLAGTGGAGKTRLALEAAALAAPGPDFPDGVYFVPLAPLDAAEFLASAIAKAVRLNFYGPDEPARQLVRHLGDRRLLLVLDNFEHLLASGGAALVSDLLRQAPGLKLLATSRERLHLQGEWLLQVGGLDLPPPGELAPDPQAYSATRLFLQAAERAWPAARQSLSESDRRSVARICRLVDGMPLALELAADWVRVLALDEIAAEIEHGHKFLEADTRDLPERHRSLWAVCDHSWALLSPAEQTIYRRLAIFRGGFTREAAEQVAGATLARLAALAGKSVLHRTPAGRYELHELLRQYAAARLDEAQETETVAAHHRDYYQSILIQADDILWGAMEVAQLERLEVEQENLRAALLWSQAHADHEAYLRLVNGLISFWFVRADYGEGRRWLEDAVARGAGASSAARAAANLGAGALAEWQGDLAGAKALLEASLALRREVGEERHANWASLHLGRVALLQGEFDRAVTIYHEVVATFRRIAYQPGIANALMYLGMALSYRGQPVQAESLLAESLPLLREANDAWAVARALFGLGKVALHRGELARAMDLLQESLRLARERRDRAQMVECVEAIAFVAGARGYREQAARLLGAAECQAQANGQLRPPGLRADYERNLIVLQSQMDRAVFSQLWAEGRRLDEAATLLLAEALADVLSDDVGQLGKKG